jgi:hypothetical protein
MVQLDDAARHVVPEVLNRVQIGQVGRKVDAGDAIVVQPGAHGRGGVIGTVVLQEVPCTSWLTSPVIGSVTATSASPSGGWSVRTHLRQARSWQKFN